MYTTLIEYLASVIRLYGGYHVPRHLVDLPLLLDPNDPDASSVQDDRQRYSDSSLQLVTSAGQMASSLCVAMLVDRGLLEYEKPIASYWPEFAQNGKEFITVQQLMMHQAGLVLLDTTLTPELLNDVEKLATILARQRPMWRTLPPTPPKDSGSAESDSENEFDDDAAASTTTKRAGSSEPGSSCVVNGPRQAVHLVTRELYVSELLRRVDPQHRSLARFFEDEVAVPLSIDMFIGLPNIDELFPRVSPWYTLPPASMALAVLPRLWMSHSLARVLLPSTGARFWGLDDSEAQVIRHLLQSNTTIDGSGKSPAASTQQREGSLAYQSLRQVVIESRPWYERYTHPSFLSLPVASINTYATAHALGVLASVFAQYGETPLGCPTRSLLRRETVAKALEYDTRSTPFDETLRVGLSFTRGGIAAFADGSFGWGGIGGSLSVWHPETRVAFGYVSNQLGVRYPWNVCNSHSLTHSLTVMMN